MSDLLNFLLHLDQQIFHLINSDLAFGFGNQFFPVITDLHRTWGFKFIFAPLLLLLFFRLRKWDGIMIFFSMGLTMGLADHVGAHLKRFFERPRPFEVLEAFQRSPAGGFSFPSNHAINMFTMAFFLSYFFPRGRWLYWTIALLICYSRIYNGVHYPSDVLGGAVIGSFFGISCSHLLQKIIQKIHAKRGAYG